MEKPWLPFNLLSWVSAFINLWEGDVELRLQHKLRYNWTVVFFFFNRYINHHRSCVHRPFSTAMLNNQRVSVSQLKFAMPSLADDHDDLDQGLTIGIIGIIGLSSNFQQSFDFHMSHVSKTLVCVSLHKHQRKLLVRVK